MNPDSEQSNNGVEFAAPEETPSRIVLKKPERREPTAFEQAINGAREMAKAELLRAQSLEEFLLYTHAVRNLDPEKLRWADSGEDTGNADEWFEFYRREKLQNNFKTEVEIEQTLIEKARSAKQDKTTIIIAKAQGPEGNWDQYRLLGIVPKDAGAMYDQRRENESGPNIIYMGLSSACCGQAADDILRGESIRIIETEPKNLSEVGADLDFTPDSEQQNFKYRDEEGNTIGTRDSPNYLHFALLGGFSNEDARYRITPYVDRL